jgi:predicted aconitase with swiveling domain
MKIRCKTVSKGLAEGELLLSREPVSFLGGVDPTSGRIFEKGHPLEGVSIAGKVLAFPKGKGSTVGAYAIYQLKKKKKAPAAMINLEADTMVASGAIISGIPMVHKPEKDIFTIKQGTRVFVNADKGYVEVLD